MTRVVGKARGKREGVRVQEISSTAKSLRSGLSLAVLISIIVLHFHTDPVLQNHLFARSAKKCKKCKKCKKLAPNVKVSETCRLFNGCQNCAPEKVTFPLKLRGPPPGGRPAATKVRKSLSFARVYCVYDCPGLPQAHFWVFSRGMLSKG